MASGPKACGVAAVGCGRPQDAREGGGEKAERALRGRSRDSPPFPQVPGAMGEEPGVGRGRKVRRGLVDAP